MKLLWTGTDSLMMNDTSRRSFRKRVYWKLAKMVVRFIQPFLQTNLVNSPFVEHNLNQIGIDNVEYIETPMLYPNPLPKKDHKGFNVVYYSPKWFTDGFGGWLYGWDIFLGVKDRLYGLDINYIILSGEEDMRDIYPITDFYLRCNRHDGNSRMIRECRINDIPYYWSSLHPDADEAADMIFNEYKKKYNYEDMRDIV